MRPDRPLMAAKNAIHARLKRRHLGYEEGMNNTEYLSVFTQSPPHTSYTPASPPTFPCALAL
jgi:hypothetical protein